MTVCSLCFSFLSMGNGRPATRAGSYQPLHQQLAPLGHGDGAGDTALRLRIGDLHSHPPRQQRPQQGSRLRTVSTLDGLLSSSVHLDLAGLLTSQGKGTVHLFNNEISSSEFESPEKTESLCTTSIMLIPSKISKNAD